MVGGSAGSVQALQALVGGLPPDLPAALMITMHVAPEAPSRLPKILSRAGPLPASHAVDGEPITPGRIYVAPPDHHLIVSAGRVQLNRGPRENGHRPAVDPLFRSAAHAYGPRVSAVVLSGAADDGSAGLIAVKGHGGAAVVQDPREAQHPGMPESAIETGVVDAVLPVSSIRCFLIERAGRPVPAVPAPTGINRDPEPHGSLPADEPATDPSAFSCPECHGTLFKVEDQRLHRFRCRIGHAYSPKSLEAEQAKSVEDVLWTAVRALEEREALLRDLGTRLRLRGSERGAGRMEDQAAQARAGADSIRNLLTKGPSPVPDHSQSQG